MGIYVQASDGREFVVTKRMVRERFQIETGTVPARKLKVKLWLRQQLVAALGAEQIDPAGVEHEFDESDGTPSDFSVTG